MPVAQKRRDIPSAYYRLTNLFCRSSMLQAPHCNMEVLYFMRIDVPGTRWIGFKKSWSAVGIECCESSVPYDQLAFSSWAWVSEDFLSVGIRLSKTDSPITVVIYSVLLHIKVMFCYRAKIKFYHVHFKERYIPSNTAGGCDNICQQVCEVVTKFIPLSLKLSQKVSNNYAFANY